MSSNAKPGRFSHISKEEKKNIIILYVLYVLQGFPIGFFAVALKILLTEKGIGYKEIAELSLSLYPFTFKFLTAPFLDTYYSKKFGQRKTYIVPLQYLFGLLAILLSFSIEDLIENQQIAVLTLYGFAMCFIMAQQDVAVDGWVLTMLTEENIGYGSTCNNLGQLTGSFFTSTIFILLNSTKFCNDWIYSEPQDQPICTSKQFLIVIGLITIGVTVIVHFFIPEKSKQQVKNEQKLKNEYQTVQQTENGENNQQQNQNQNNNQYQDDESLSYVLKCLVGFFTNSNLRWFIFILITYKIGFSPIGATADLELIKKGFEKEKIVNMGTLLMPVIFLSSIAASAYVKKGQELTMVKLCFFARILDGIISYIIVSYFEYIQNETLQMALIFISSVISTLIVNFNFVAMGTFYNRITDIEVGGSYLTVLNSISNLGGQASDSFALYLHGLFDFNTVVIGGFIYSIVYILIFNRKLTFLEKLPKQSFKLSIEKHHNKQEK